MHYNINLILRILNIILYMFQVFDHKHIFLPEEKNTFVNIASILQTIVAILFSLSSIFKLQICIMYYINYKF